MVFELRKLVAYTQLPQNVLKSKNFADSFAYIKIM